jgi:hypothetical protein
MYTLNDELMEKYQSNDPILPPSAWFLNHKGIACLRQNAQLRYPKDAYAHFQEIHIVMQLYLQAAQGHNIHEYSGYSGPWIENE